MLKLIKCIYNKNSPIFKDFRDICYIEYKFNLKDILLILNPSLQALQILKESNTGI
jgi:hypothetical protein